MKNEEIVEGLTKLKRFDLISNFQNVIPNKSIEKYKKDQKGKIRERVFTIENTLYGMIYQASQEDKSKQNAVMMLNKLHNDRLNNIKVERERLEKQNKTREQEYKKLGKKPVGRPQKRLLKIQKSKEKPISLYPSSYDEATKRFPKDLMEEIFEETAQWFYPKESIPKWKGKNVYQTDGTTFKTPDTEELRNYYNANDNDNINPLPIGRIQAIRSLYGGGIVGLSIGNYKSSELKMIKKLIKTIPKESIILGDDFYSGYGFFSYCKANNINLIVRGKHLRKETIIKQIAKGDQIVQWESNQKPRWFDESDELPDNLQIRKLTFTNPEKPRENIVLYTNLLDTEEFSAIDIIALHTKRWDIEITFRQIKSILKLEYLRGLTVDMVKKEIYAHIILYNIMRRIMRDEISVKNGVFSPLHREVQVSSSMAKGEYVDKRGRSYFRWNAGRYKRNINKT